jgi:hypothetical protein
LDFFGFYGGFYPAYVRGQAFMALHQYGDAEAEFQIIANHRGILAADPIGALAQLQLARSLRLRGDRAKAERAYQDFLGLWKNADSESPILRMARAEHAELQ